MKTKIKVALVEDNILLRTEMGKLLNDSAELRVVASLPDYSQLVPIFKEVEPDLVLMDIGLGGNVSGIDGVKIITNYFPEIRIMMFTVFEDEDKIFESICAGASGYLLKKTPPTEIIRSLVELYLGGAPMTPVIADRALKVFRSRLNPAPAEGAGLTAREREILQALAEGLSYQKIADKLYIHISTVRTHITNIYHKLRVNSKVEAINRMQRHRIN
ncbi:MAG TPA: response regulator transcription factor [Chitinophagaceae bacterium]|nr:response regulator transcription factor [Chitinophagaceae bacterium]